MSFRLGSFEVLEKIASGGMGDIWRGVHVSQDVPVAIKVIRRDGAEDLQFRKAFRQEVRAVAQLDHPGIVTVFDVGEVPEEVATASDGELDGGSPYLVMEYLATGSLEAVEFPLPWPRAREILIGMLRSLGHAHARGITHRDLKPGNVLVAEPLSGSPIRLTDFGIAFSYRESRPTDSDGVVVGTPVYMAPEQFMAEWRDFGPWTDLYALGCMAYEISSGRVPFEHREIMQLGTAHIGHQPSRPKCLPDYPEGFGDWVLRLLEKQPRNRYRRCADAAAALASLTADAPVPPEAVMEGPPKPRRPFKLVGAGLRLFGLRTVPMVNRDAERERMRSTFERVAQSGGIGVVVLEGAAGSGKSRLAEWVYERTDELGLADCFKAEHRRTQRRAEGLSHMLADAWSCLGMDARELRNRVAAILSSAGIDAPLKEAAVAELLAPASLGEEFSPGMFHEFRSQAARHSLLFEVLRRIYRERPMVVWLDDVHWGTDALNFIRYASERSAVEPLAMMAVLTARDDLLVQLPEASALLRELCSNDAATCLRVEPLSSAYSRLLVGNLLYLQGDLAERVSVRSAGNPLYATQLVGDWVNRGILEAGSSGFILTGETAPDMPDDVHNVWVQRLERVLDESAVNVFQSSVPGVHRIEMQVALELAAVLGGRIDPNEWKAVCSLAGVSDPGPALESLLAARMAQVAVDGWSFSHSMLRESIERIARERLRWASHNRLCADMLEQRRPVPHWGDSERIGRYRFEAAQFDAATAPLLRGAREQMRLEEYSAALDLLGMFDRALDELERPEGDPQRLEGWLLQADIFGMRRDLHEAEALATRVRAAATNAEAKWFDGAALLVLARVHQNQRRLRTALGEFQEAQRLLRDAGARQKLAICLSEQAETLLELDSLDPAWQAFNESQEIYEEIGQFIPWAENQLGLARVALRRGDPEHAMTLCRRVRAFAGREGLNRIEVAACVVLAEVQRATEQLADAEISLDRSIELFEQLGLARQAFHPRLLKILLRLESGAVDQARLEVEQLRMSVNLEVPRASRSFMSCVELAIAVDAPAPDFRASCKRTVAILAETEALSPHAVRCLRLAARRAERMGYPDRASRVQQIGEAASMPVEVGESGAGG